MEENCKIVQCWTLSKSLNKELTFRKKKRWRKNEKMKKINNVREVKSRGYRKIWLHRILTFITGEKFLVTRILFLALLRRKCITHECWDGSCGAFWTPSGMPCELNHGTLLSPACNAPPCQKQLPQYWTQHKQSIFCHQPPVTDKKILTHSNSSHFKLGGCHSHLVGSLGLGKCIHPLA